MTSTVWAFAAAVSTFIISAAVGKKLIPFLHRLHYGQTILDDGPSWHKKKQGTPTMGGIMMIIAFFAVTLVCAVLYFCFGIGADNVNEAIFPRDKVHLFAGLIMALCFAAIGFADDYIKVVKKRNLGLTAKQKLVLQFASAALYLGILAAGGYTTQTIIPFVGYVDLGFFYYIIAAVLIVGTVNAVNLNDGIDGLCGSVTFFAALGFMVIAAMLGYNGVTFESAALAGACLGFLVWNFNPAKVFMGDTGSLFLGGALCALAFALQAPILLIPIGMCYYIEMFSIMLQVSYFKITHGKRLFKMSPIHHHFELCGWSEKKIVLVFGLISAVLAVIAFILHWSLYGIK